MRYLVTGAAGFVGSHLCAALLKRNGTVWALDDLSKGQPERLAPLERNLRFHFLRGSITQRIDALAEIIELVEVIYNLAAVVGVYNYVEDPVRVVEVNVCETLALMKLAWSHGKKVVFTSTSEVYGKITSCPSRKMQIGLWASRHRPLVLRRSQEAAEHICPATPARPSRGDPALFNLWAGRRLRARRGVSRLSARRYRPAVTVHGDGNRRAASLISMTSCGHHCRGEKGGGGRKIFNLGSNEEISIPTGTADSN